MKIGLILFTLVVLVAIGTLFIRRDQPAPTNGNGGDGVTPTTADGNDPGVTSPPSRSDNIIVTSPTAGSTVSSPLVVRGEARTFENSVSVRLSEADGTVLIEDNTTAQSPDIGQFGPFEIELSYPMPSQSAGILEVFQYSAKDGSEIDKVTIPVQFETKEYLTIQVYFNNSVQGTECEQVVATPRQIPRTQQTARAALEQLLQGPTVSEAEKGFITSINPGVKINRLVIENGVAKGDFDETLQAQVAGSCRVAAIRAQITQTLLQFDSIQDVVISINGRTEDILQP